MPYGPRSEAHTSRRRWARRVLLALSLVALLALVSGGPRAVSVARADHWEPRANGVTVNDRWMADLAAEIGNRRIKHVVIPGAHDAATYGLLHYSDRAAPGYAINQHIDIYTQLQHGIRQFDLRAQSWEISGGLIDYFIYHGPYTSDLRLRNVLDEIRRWVVAPGHEKEIIILNIQAVRPTSLERFDGICSQFRTGLDGLLLTPASLGPSRDIAALTVNEIWNLPQPPRLRSAGPPLVGSPRVIVDWPDCTGTWSPGTWNGYYANQCFAEPYRGLPALQATASGPLVPVLPERLGVISALAAALERRALALDVPNGESTHSPLGSAALRGFYSLSVASTITADCAYPLDWFIPQQERTLDAVKGWWDNYQRNSRTNLNIISADFVEKSKVVEYAIAMNRSPRIDVKSPSAGGEPTQYGLNEVVVAAYNCLDASGSAAGITSCTGSALSCTALDTRSAGAKSLTLRATDRSGNTSNRTVSYTVSSAPSGSAESVVPGSIWVIGEESSVWCHAGGADSGTAWQRTDGAGVRVAVGPGRQPFVVNSAGEIFRRSTAGVWSRIPGVARDIGVGADGSVWVTGDNGGIWYLRPGAGGIFLTVDGAGSQIAVGPEGQPWVVNDAGEIWRRSRGSQGFVNGAWERLPGRARDIGVGGDGSAWILEADGSVARWTGSAWSRIDGAGVRITVDRYGQPWVVNDSRWIFRRQANGTWVRLAGEALDIAAGGAP